MTGQENKIKKQVDFGDGDLAMWTLGWGKCYKLDQCGIYRPRGEGGN
jgi:hypothetical protein